MELGLNDILAVLGALGTVAVSHFNLRTQIKVLEERVAGHSDMFERIERSLRRIEEKIDSKADR